MQPLLALSPISGAVSRLVCSPTRIPSLTIGNSIVFTPSSSKPMVAMPPGIVRSAVMFISFEPYFSLPTSDSFTKLVPA